MEGKLLPTSSIRDFLLILGLAIIGFQEAGNINRHQHVRISKRGNFAGLTPTVLGQAFLWFLRPGKTAFAIYPGSSSVEKISSAFNNTRSSRLSAHRAVPERDSEKFEKTKLWNRVVQRFLRALKAKQFVAAGWVSFALITSIPGSMAQAGAGGTLTTTPIKAVVELFTSQGCSSCPPADRLLKTYVDRKDVIALSFPVDYWDYLGWQDTYASQMNTERQRAYARARGDGSVYTPQAVVNGISHFVGSRKSKIDACIKRDLEKDGGASRVPLRLSLEGGQFVVETGTVKKGQPEKQLMLWIVAVQKSGTVNIARGENSGHKFTYYNIVRGMTPIGSWDGTPKTIRISRESVSKPHADTYLVLLQKGSSGPIIGASWLSK